MKTVYYNANVITMGENGVQEAFACEDGSFIDVGTNERILSVYPDAAKNDLNQQTVMPSFLDAHSHLSSYANTFLQASLDEAESFADILRILGKFAEDRKIRNGEWLIANGYDHNCLKEKRQPTKEMLDDSFPGICTVLQHKSGHFGVLSSAALRATGMEGKDDDGYLKENEYVDAIKKLPIATGQDMADAYKSAQLAYASYGITTIQEGMMVSQMIPIYNMLLSQNMFMLDVVGYPQIADADKFYDAFPQCNDTYYANFRLGGYKILMDGSPQGRTAWMKTPYEGSTDEFGVSNMTDDAVKDAIRKSITDHRQLLAHCNGDMAAEQLLTCADEAATVEDLAEIRPVLIHGQLLATNQLPRIKKYGIIPSFFIAHCYYWGDTHIENFGYERARKISPAGSALKDGIMFTFHQDTPVIKPDMMRTVWCAVNRITKNGVVLGDDERIPVIEALKAVTINVARQYGEDKTKGSIEPRKNADFIILSDDPLTSDPMKLSEIKVVKTYRCGKCIYERKL